MINKQELINIQEEAINNDGRCSTCYQAIKIYRYKINRVHALFLRAMAKAVSEQNANDIDIGAIGLAYSTRSQNSKIRQHGLIARVKNEKGAQVPRRWLITRKGWDFLHGKPITEYVIVYNNQVLGHDGEDVTIQQVLGERYDPDQPVYQYAPANETEARVYNDIREPRKDTVVSAMFRNRHTLFTKGDVYELTIDRLEVGKPITILRAGTLKLSNNLFYKDIAAFYKDWRVV